MQKDCDRGQKLNIYIDGNNLYRSAKELGFEIDYKKFGVWLRQKYNPNKIYIFIGLVPEKLGLYKYLQNSGYILIFKQAVIFKQKIKGNCDAELVLKATSDFYENKFNSVILITGDGDFGCLIEFLKNRLFALEVIAPDRRKCSNLIKNKYVKIIFLNDLYHKFSDRIWRPKTEKAPDTDASA